MKPPRPTGELCNGAMRLPDIIKDMRFNVVAHLCTTLNEIVVYST